jgi:putative ABC transport system substrate-binding protein
MSRKNIAVALRSSEGDRQRLRALVAELLRLKVDVIVAGGSAVTRVVKEATSTIPIIMAQDSDPVRNGFVASLARPGGNITGLSTVTPEIRGKQLELLMEIVPGISRVAVFHTSNQPGNAQAVKEVELAARVSGVKLQYLDVIDATTIDTAFLATANAQGRRGSHDGIRPDHRS